MSNTFREIETRIKHKIDTVGKWSEVEDTFIPLDGELIIYRGVVSNDNNTSQETIHFKVGNNSDTLGELPFAYDTELLELATAIADETSYREESDAYLQGHITAIRTNTIPNTPTAAWGQEVNLGTAVSADKVFKFTMPDETSVSISASNDITNSISNRTFTAITGLSTSDTNSHEIITQKTTFTLPADQNTSHTHSAGVGLTGSGNAGISGGTYTYNINLVNEDKSSNSASYTVGGSSKFYAVQLDKNNKLGVYVPWEDDNDNQKIKVGTISFGANDDINLIGGTDITLTPDTTDKSITINYTGSDNYHMAKYQSGLQLTTTTSDTLDPIYVPTGTDANTVAIGNHNHDGRYSLSGHTHSSYIPITEKGANNGVATLDSNGRIPSGQLPSYVDDILEGYLSNDGTYFYYLDDSNRENRYTGEIGKIYVDLTYHKCYRYSGTTYVEISPSIALSNETPKKAGTASVGTASTAARGDHVHPSDTSKLSLSGGTLTGNLTINDTSSVTKSYLTLPNLQSLRVGTAGHKSTNPSYVATFMNNKAEDGFAYSTIDDIIKNNTIIGQFNSYHSGNIFSNPNDATKSGIYYINDETNRPPFPDNTAGAKDYNITVTTYSNDISNLWCQQIARDYRSDYIFYRRCEKGVWKNWVKIYPQDINNINGGTV